MEIILNNESNESMKHIFENNYKKCNLIYDNYLFKLELLGNNLVKNINNEMTISLDEQLKKIG